MTGTLTYSSLAYYVTGETAGNNIWLDNVNAILADLDNRAGRVCAGSTIVYPTAKDYIIIPNVRFAGTLKKVFVWTDAGTLTANFKVNSTTVTDGDVSATSSKGNNTPTAQHTFVVNDDIKISLASVSGVGEVYWALWIDRTSAGTA